VNDPSDEVARTVMEREAPSTSRSMAPSDGNDTRSAVDGKSSTVAVLQRIGNRVVGRVDVTGGGSDTYHDRSDGAFSLTLLLVALVSVTEPTSNSSTSLMAMEKVWSVNEPSAEVARTVMEREAPSASRSMAAATVTTPVVLSMANRPPSLFCKRIGDGVVGSVDVAGGCGDTYTVPTAAFSLTLLLVALVSVTAPTSNSSTSLMAMEKFDRWDPSLEVARTVMLREAPSASRSMAPATVTTPVVLSIANRPPSLLKQRIGDGVIGRVEVAGGSRDTYDRTHGCIFIDIIAGALVSVTGRRRIRRHR
jgi:hypothetical protein